MPCAGRNQRIRYNHHPHDLRCRCVVCSGENHVHGFYLDGLAEMLRDLPRADIDLYVSTPHWQFSAMAALLRQQRWPRVRLFAVPNRGRDLAPFLLQMLPVARAAGHRSFIKLHTKSSPHLSEGQDWAAHLVDSLLDPVVVEKLLREPVSGLLAPAGTLVPITLQLHNNARQHVCRLPCGAGFVAGIGDHPG